MKRRARILFVHDTFGRVSEVFIDRMIMAFERSEVSMLAGRYLRREHYELPQERIHRWNPSAITFRHKMLPWLNRKLSRRGMRSALHSVIAAEIRNSDADLVCFQFATLAAELGRDIVRIRKPFCLFHHGSDVNRAREDSAYRQRLVEVWRQAEKLFFVSEFLRRTAIDLGAPKSKCVVRYLGVPLPESTRQKGGDGILRFVSLARMVPVKNHLSLVRGFALFLRHYTKPSQLLLIGSGEEEAAVRNEVRRLGIARQVRFAGALENTKALEELSRSDVAVLVSRIHRIPGVMLQEEALGISLLEGAVRGLPMIGANTGGIPEIVREGETGYLVDPEDPESIARAMLRMALEPEHREKMGRNAQKTVRENFEILERTRQIENDLISLAGVS